MTLFHIWSDTDLVTLILSAHLEAVVIVEIFCAARFQTVLLYVLFISDSVVMTLTLFVY